ncbi:MAG: hypothetical protein KF760_19420 [Candidatus Eremiobacteraeota bacterium]|nr:hypothetical protein [Candidatus Eremiobacteraeota bacterium]MCW5868313.1 hypothetical protein [Candidatus Eremiobacteraeota bacterium]
MSTTTAPMRANYLVSRTLDFWLLGGASVVAYLAMTVAGGFRNWYGVSNQFGNLAVTMSMMSLFVNYPHFLASYRLAYGRGQDFVVKHWFHLLLVPSLLLGFLTCAYCLAVEPQSRGLSEQLLGAGINFMFFTVGWHYAKQAFGCMMVYSAYDRYPLDRVQRESLRFSLLSLWWYNFTNANLNPTGTFWSLKYSTWQLPGWLYLGSFWIFQIMIAVVLYRVFFRNWRAGYRPSPTFLIPYVAMMLWFAPCFRQPDFFFYVVPFFHSLQYLTFVYRVERSRPSIRESAGRATALVFGLALSGWMCFEVVPGNLDMSMEAMTTFGFSFCLIAANLFINIHHYFIDNVLWRVRDDPQVRQALFSDPV